MKRWCIPLAVAAALAGGAFAQAASAATQYHVVELPSLGGSYAIGNSINRFGMVAGFSTLADNQTIHAAAWPFGVKTDLGTLGGTHSAVLWPVKNDFGLISGISQTGTPDPNGESWSCSAFIPKTGSTCLGFLWIAGKMRALQPLPGGNNSFATGTNNRMQTVGWAETGYHDPTCNTHHDSDQVLQFLPVVWGPGRNQIRTLPLLAGDSDGAATAINDHGDIVGISGDCDQAVGRDSARHMVLWTNGKAIDLGNIGGGSWNTPMAINGYGDIVGFASTAGGDLHAFYRGRADAAPTDMGVLYPADTLSQAYGINDDGVAVGMSCGSECNAFVWQDGVMTDLQTLAPGYSGTFLYAQDINELGEITGQAKSASGDYVTFLAVPIPSSGSH
jgi:probable HAF family extracellular repeat protein